MGTRGANIGRGRALRVGIGVLVAVFVVTALAPGAAQAKDTSHCSDRDDLDVGLVIDRSGSMGGDKLDSAKDGARNLTDRLNGTDQSGLVSYSDDATLDRSLSTNHSATKDAIDALSAGGGTATGAGINVSHEDLKDNGRVDARPIMILLTDGMTNAGPDPVAEADEAKADGIEIFSIGLGDNINEDELRAIASEPNSTHFYHPLTSDELNQTFTEIAGRITRNDTADPTVDIGVPEPGRTYFDGVDLGPAPYTDRARVVGNLSFTATAGDDCYLDRVDFETAPDVGWSDSVNATNITTSEFPGETAPLGNYTLNATATDWVLNRTSDTARFELTDEIPPAFVDPSPCATGEVVEGIEGVLVSARVRASSMIDDNPISLSLHDAPAGVRLDADPPANPVDGEIVWRDPVEGEHTVVVEATDSHGFDARCRVPLDIDAPTGQATAVGLWAGTAVPESVTYRTAGVHQTGEGADDHTTATVDHADPGTHVEGLHESGRVDVADGVVTSTASVRVEKASLLGGRVVVEGLTHNATARWNMSTNTSTIDVTRRIARVVVDGTPVPVDGTSERIALPGGGELTLFGADRQRVPDRVRYRGNLVHLYAPAPYGTHEVVVGDILLRGSEDLAFRSAPHRIEEHDDANSGRDAGAGPSDAVPVGPGLHDGHASGDDQRDAYAVDLAHGEKVEVVLNPPLRVQAVGGALHADPGGFPPATVTPPTTAIEDHRLRLSLLGPDGEVRARPGTSTSGDLPQKVELNAPVDGTYTVIVESSRFDDMQNYTFALSITPVPLLPQNDARSGGDAPDACDPADPAIPTVTSGPWEGVVKHDDRVDVYRFSATAGDLITATLKPGETEDGVDMRLDLLDGACDFVVGSQRGGPYSEKGFPERVLQVAPSTGTYHLRVTRLNGVGNHHVTLGVQDPMPGLPDNDAGTGEDAPTRHEDADEAPPLAFQGDLPDGDAGDAYLIPFEGGHLSTVTVQMSFRSQVAVRVITPSGTLVTPTVSPADGSGPTWVFAFYAPTTGLYGLEIEPTSGGGEYVVAHR